ncbi:Phage integrase [Paraburkholderia sabiae]|uniref:gamma-mobile-trio recombinase GmtY n=1 Tax=Paraburkholderia sabiae TaxID=273251 RepID=UPI001CAE0623|nr:gamma-mobile-trio recombinase GmtY [Paraburkholderia sabiae]CAG9228554.1 Phage integrase [Paraburkholderia sabiae]
MDHTSVRATIYEDNTGVAVTIPVLLTEAGYLDSLIEYCIANRNRSYSWMQKLVQAIGLLLDYTDANFDCFEQPADLFDRFVHCLHHGTVKQGTDPSGLYWSARRTASARQLSEMLAGYSDWLENTRGTAPLAPWRDATLQEQRLRWAAWHHKRSRAFLGHTWDRRHAAAKVAHARTTSHPLSASVRNGTPSKRFPGDQIEALLFNGFIVPGKQRAHQIELRLNLRDILITMLQHYGGLRMSEPFHLYVHDVLPDPIHPERAFVRIFHPSQGLAPPDWIGPNGRPVVCNREAYLRGRYGFRPRNQYAKTDQLHAGWKGRTVDSPENFLHVHWFPTWSGALFSKFWALYMFQRSRLGCQHPFAFVTRNGKPYSIDSYSRAHRRAVERIGLVCSKALGTSPHGHRHDYGGRLSGCAVDPLVVKQTLHHASLESQLVYTAPEEEQISATLEAASRRLDSGCDNKQYDFLRYGFEDVDPLGLLSGPWPKLAR